MELNHRIIIISLLAAGVMTAGAAGAAEVYRWVDENGEVHYSESLPPDFKEKGHDVLNSSGLVIDEDVSQTPPPPPEPTPEDKKELPRDKSGLPRPKALYSEAELQRRMDNFLMLRYDSEQEITDAMNVEIKQLEYDRRLLQTTRASMIDSFQGEIREAANQQRAGQQVSEKVSKDLNQLQSRLAENLQSLNALEQRELSIHAEFDKQLARYRFLQEEWDGDESGGETGQ
jgi:hypothetical protein